MIQNYYKVADLYFCLEAEKSIFDQMNDYLPFLTDKESAAESLFTLTIKIGVNPGFVYTQDTFRDEDGLTVTNGHTAEGADVFIYQLNHHDLFWLICEEHHRKGTLIITSYHPRIALDFGITIIYRYNAITQMTGVIHASTVSFDNKAWLFLGLSGTGKSTHSRLWMKYFDNVSLVNDDKPIIRIFDNDEVRVYGSPWSGKTPCYRQVNYPIGGMVKLQQAPHNRIRRLNAIESYYVLLHSFFGKRWDPHISDAIHQFEERLVRLVPMWHLECLPDEDAAKLCKDTITNNNK